MSRGKVRQGPIYFLNFDLVLFLCILYFPEHVTVKYIRGFGQKTEVVFKLTEQATKWLLFSLL